MMAFLMLLIGFAIGWLWRGKNAESDRQEFRAYLRQAFSTLDNRTRAKVAAALSTTEEK